MDLPKALLFDLDGVLIDSEPLHGIAWKQTASNFETELSRDQLDQLKGRRRKDCAKKVCDWIKKPTSIESILKIHAPISSELIKTAKAMPGAERIVEWCFTNKMPIALVTSSASASVSAKTSPHPWINYFSTKVYGDDPFLKRGKPSPDPYLLAAKKLKVDPNFCWAIEDSLSGTKSALSAGCKVWVLDKATKMGLSKENISNNPSKINQLDLVLQILQENCS